MSHEIKGNTMVVKFDPNSREPSSTGKSYMLASSHGYQKVQLTDGSEISIQYNVIRKIPK